MVSKTLLQFFLDGYDTLGAVISMTLYFLTIHPQVQEKASEEVDSIDQLCSGRLTAEHIPRLKYLDQVFSEASRMAPVPRVYRACTKDWPLPGKPDVVIPKGMRVMIPIYGLHVRKMQRNMPSILILDRS